jgi:UDP-N-acetylmuramoylalanine--D-glutamate ligase
VLLNITPDHLDRYGYNFQNYIDSKFRILQNAHPDDTFVYFQESVPITAELAKRQPAVLQLPISLKTSVLEGGYLADGELVATANGQQLTLPQTETTLRGPHNAINSLAAILVAQSLGILNEAIIDGLKTFTNAAHRLEPAGKINGVQYINDSKATNVDSVFYALSSMEAPTVWIAGGQDKGNDYQQLDEVVQRHVKALVCLGIDNQKLLTYFADKIPVIRESRSMEDAIAQAQSLSESGDVVLLSPACASFDLFKNYEDRGNQFKAVVQSKATLA